jgi:2-dehydro-3-deoxyglucarate aldolase/4-hydroxy-2-oxoheptanedioate aldolase
MVFELFTPGIAAICVQAGADFVLFDMEHSAVGIGDIRAQMAFCRGLPLAPLVRVPAGEYHFIARVLDAGAHGVMVPMVESAAQAESVVRACRYPPLGRRGAGFSVAHDAFAPGDVAQKMLQGNERTLVMAQIESERGLAAVDEIAAVPGIDVLWLGMFDLSNFLGVPGQFGSQPYLRAVDRLVAAAARENRILAVLASDEAWGRDYIARGFSMLAYGPEQVVLLHALGAGVSMLRAI